MEINIENLKNTFKDCDDFFSRRVYADTYAIDIAYIDGTADKAAVDNFLLRSLTFLEGGEFNSDQDMADKLLAGMLPFISMKKIEEYEELISQMLDGQALVIFQNINTALSLDTRNFARRGVGEPTNESVLKGGKDGFTESLRTNTSLIRSRLKTDKLVIKERNIGDYNNRISVVYLSDKVDEKVLNEFNAKLDAINIDNLLSAAAFEEYINTKKSSMMPQLLYTERPDKLANNILEGKIGVFVDGISLAYILPSTFNMLMQSSEDYSSNFITASTTRVLRYISFALAVLAPAIYLAVMTFHQELLPRDLAVTIVRSKQNVPFPSFVEIAFMLLAFELLIEAGLRMPKSIGSAVSIVGALIVGDAAVSSGLMSHSVIVAVAISGICGFAMPSPDLANSVRVWRAVFLFAAFFAGFIGIIFCAVAFVFVLTGIETFGVPFLYPFVDKGGGKGDMLVRPPLVSE
jgi:spore germination protein KA